MVPIDLSQLDKLILRLKDYAAKNPGHVARITIGIGQDGQPAFWWIDDATDRLEGLKLRGRLEGDNK